MHSPSVNPPLPPADRPHPKPSWRRLLKWIACLLLLGVLTVEVCARVMLGLGDPPLFQLDDKTEYLLVPSRNYKRFGNEYSVNAFSQRSPEFSPKKTDPNELRVMVIGDSIINAGPRIPQRFLATELLKQRLSTPSRAAVIGNISAGSWGPPNQLGYVQKFGLFDADYVAIVLNSDDVADVPGLEYLGSAWPRTKPWCATQELLSVYAWRSVCRLLGISPEPPAPPRTSTVELDTQTSKLAFMDLVAACRARGAKVVLIQFLKQPEVQGDPEPAFSTIFSWAQEANVPVSNTLQAFRDAAKTGPSLYLPGDQTHTSVRGQAVLAEVIAQAIEAQKKQDLGK